MNATRIWPHYSVTLDAIIAGAVAYFEENALDGVHTENRWHPEDVSSAVVTVAEAVGAALGKLINDNRIKVNEDV